MGGLSIPELTARIIKEADPRVGDKEANPGTLNKPKPDEKDANG